jgi:hypothetical protein
MGADNVTSIFSESPRGQVFPACYDPAPVVPHVSVAFAGHRWRVHTCDVGVVHAGSGVVRLARVDYMVSAWRGVMSRGVLTLPSYL